MHYSPNNLNDSFQTVPVPSSPEEVIRIFPQLVSMLQNLQNRISALENKIKSLETIPGNSNQL